MWYVVLRVHGLLTTVYQQNSVNAIYSYQVPYMLVHVMAPGQRLRRLRHVGGAKRVPDALVRAGQLRETTPTEKHRSSRIAGDWAWG